MKQPNNTKTKIYSTALYMRLSRDDENFGDSVSIETQRTILQKFAAENGLRVYGEYVDDGWSGTNFDRPSFQRMMNDVEAGKVNCIVTKDLSRFGREHVMMDYYLEFVFPEKQIRYIAIAENEDTEKGLSEFVPFKNLFKNISHSGKVSNDFSLFRRFCCINRCFRCSCGKFSIVHGVQAAIGFQAVAIGEKGDLPETHPVQLRTESKRPCRLTRAKPASKGSDRALSV